MRILITGTPGTGKTSVSRRLGQIMKMEVIHLNDIIFREKLIKGYDKERATHIVDLSKLEGLCKRIDNAILEGHLSHFCMRDGDIVIILRARPIILKRRLRMKGYDRKKIEENVEAEIIDLITQEVSELGERYDVRIYEIDTSDKTIDRVALIIKRIIEDENYARHFLPGSVDYTDDILEGKI